MEWCAPIIVILQFLQCCQEEQIALNRDKCKFGLTEVTFAGLLYRLNNHGSDHQVSQSCHTHRHPLFFWASKLVGFIYWQDGWAVRTIATPPQYNHYFVWSATHEKALVKVKEYLAKALTIAFFDMEKPTRICTDATRQGIGFILQPQTLERQ